MSFLRNPSKEEKEPVSMPEPIYQMIHASLYANGKLLPESKIKALEALHLEEGHYKRKKETSNSEEVVDSPCSITAFQNILFAHRTGEPLGKGGSSKVKLVQNLSSGEIDVAKILKPTNDSQIDSYYKMAYRECEILEKLGRAVTDVIIRMSRKTGLPKYQIIMKLAEGNELFFLLDKDMLPSDFVKLLQMSYDIVSEIKALFDLGYLHRDIKVENIFVDLITGKVTLIDFGLAATMNPKTLKANDGGFVGTISTYAPELFESSIYSEQTEVYAAGIILLGLLLGKVAQCTKPEEVEKKGLTEIIPLKRIVKQPNNRTLIKNIYTKDSCEISTQLFNSIDTLILSMTNKDPSKRPTLDFILDKLNELITQAKEDVPASVSSTKPFFMTTLPRAPSCTLSELLMYYHRAAKEEKCVPNIHPQNTP